jgi:hypothetical protein
VASAGDRVEFCFNFQTCGDLFSFEHATVIQEINPDFLTRENPGFSEAYWLLKNPDSFIALL